MSGEIISAEEARRLREAAVWASEADPARTAQWYRLDEPGGDSTDGPDGSMDPTCDVGCEGEEVARGCTPQAAALIAAAPDLARTVEHLHAELAAEREAVLAFLLGMARTAETPQARGLIATIRRAIELRYHRDPLRTPRTDGEVSDG